MFRILEDSIVECIVEDGREYLLNTRERFDAIAVDAFDNHGAIPKHMVQADFFRIAKNALKPQSSMVVMNVVRSHGHDILPARISANMKITELPPITLHAQSGSLNTIIGGRRID